jgi:hypothetical protein
MDNTYVDKLNNFTEDQLRREVGLLHGVLGFEGYEYYAEQRLFARQMQPGIWIKLVPPTASDSWFPVSFTLSSTWGPGWCWYISYAPDTTYCERGGACLGDQAREDAEEAYADLLVSDLLGLLDIPHRDEGVKVKAYTERASELAGEVYFECPKCGGKQVMDGKLPFKYVCGQEVDPELRKTERHSNGYCNALFEVIR